MQAYAKFRNSPPSRPGADAPPAAASTSTTANWFTSMPAAPKLPKIPTFKKEKVPLHVAMAGLNDSGLARV